MSNDLATTHTALIPAELAEGNEKLLAWLVKQCETVGDEEIDLRNAAKSAREAKYRWKHLDALAKKAGQQVMFYEKVKQAVEARFMLIPNLPLDSFLIRTTRKKPTGDSPSSWAVIRQQPLALPAGEGENRNPEAKVSYDHSWTDANGAEHRVYSVDSWENPVFPLAVAKSEVIDLTDRAARLKLFDEIGIVQDGAESTVWKNQRLDPIVVGRLRNPIKKRPNATFFIAWVMDWTRL